MEADLGLQVSINNNRSSKNYFKLALLLALLLNFIILLLLIFYSLDSNHTINFFSTPQQDRGSGSLPVYFDMPGSPQGSPSGTAQQVQQPQNLSVGQTTTSPQNLSVGFSDQDSQSNTANAQAQSYKSGAAKPSEPVFGFDDIEAEKSDIKDFDKEKAMLKEYLDQEDTAENIEQEKNLSTIVQDKADAVIEQVTEVGPESTRDLLEAEKQELEQARANIQDKVDISLWKKLQEQKIKSEKTKSQVAPKKDTKTQETNSQKTSSENSGNYQPKKPKVLGKKRVLPKKSGSIFGKELLEGFKNYMQEQKYSQDYQDRSISIGTDSSNNINSGNYNGQSGGELGRAMSSQLRGEVNGMMLIKELALASRLDESMVQSEKYIDKIIPFELTIGEHGKVLNVELKESCGAPSVDKHFVKLVYNSSPINHYARHYKGTPFKITLSIRFIVPAGANRLLVTYGGN